MTTGYVVSGRGDLDVLFKARTSAAVANTNYKSNGGVDLAQRFEPRGATPAIADTGFRIAGGTDLAQVFANIASGAITNGNMTAGQSGALFGFQVSNGADPVYGSCTIILVGSQNLLRINFNGAPGENSVQFGNGSSHPADVDTVWQRIEITGVFSGGGGSQTRTLVRSSALGTATTSSGGFFIRTWQLPGSGGPPLVFVNGNVYTVNIFRS